MDLKRERCLHAGKTDLITDVALKNLGLDFSYLKRRLGIPYPKLQALHAKNLAATDWMAICDTLCIPVDSISYGYLRVEHKARIRWACENGSFDLPRTRELKTFLREIRQDRRASARFLASHYGFRLRWKIRIQNFLRCIFSWILYGRNRFLIGWQNLLKKISPASAPRLMYPFAPKRLSWLGRVAAHD